MLKNFFYVKIPRPPCNCLSFNDCGIKKFSTASKRESDLKSQIGSLDDVPKSAQVVIAGAGIIGSSVAYHLAQNGWTDVAVLEQGRATSGATWLGCGVACQLKNAKSETLISKKSVELYQHLADRGYDIGWKQTGSISVGNTKERLTAFKRSLPVTRSMGIDAQLISPKEAADMFPSLVTKDLEAALWVPGDGVIDQAATTHALLHLAQSKGIQLIEGVRVLQVGFRDSRVAHVETSAGTINCDYFINCAGMWGRYVGKKSTPRVAVPLHPVEHYSVTTQPIRSLSSNVPILRDLDNAIYVREKDGKLVCGGFEPNAKPVFHNSIPDDFAFQQLKPDLDHLQQLLPEFLGRVENLADAGVQDITCGPEAFTPDCRPIIGEAPEVRNYFVAGGLCGMGASEAGGIGETLAHWVCYGEPPEDTEAWEIDILRFVGYHNNRRFLRDRVREIKNRVHSIKFPVREVASSRQLRTSPLYTRLRGEGAVFSETNMYERPMWFQSDKERKDFGFTSASLQTFGRPPWFEAVETEYWACREQVCLMDLSSFTKIRIESAGDEALKFLQYLCSNDVDKPYGHVVHTGMANHHGGFENDCSVVRLGPSTFFLICPTQTQTRTIHWLNTHKPEDGSVLITDVTSMYAAINVIGPKSEELLKQLTDINVSTRSFPAMTLQEIDIGHASNVLAMRLTHSGEDGWVLYVKTEYALHVFDWLQSVGQDYGVRNAGYYALRTLRVEKFFAYWGMDLTPSITAMECGREYRVKLDGVDFIGKAAMLKLRTTGIRRKFVQLRLARHDPYEDPWPCFNEPILRNGKLVGFTTSCAFGFTLQAQICLGFVHNYDDDGVAQVVDTDYLMKGSPKYEVEIAGRRFEAKLSIFTPTLKLPDSPFEQVISGPTNARRSLFK